MGFNQQVAKSYAAGVKASFLAPWAAFSGSVIALNGVVTASTTSTAGLVITPAGNQFNIEWGSLVANIQTGITTNSLAVVAQWQVSNDGTNWASIYPYSGGAYTQVNATGTGSLITTSYCLSLPGINPGHPFLRIAVLSTGATGAAGDNVTVSYNYRRRTFQA
jgi:hypothetical protein